jgi:hypothetical protein
MHAAQTQINTKFFPAPEVVWTPLELPVGGLGDGPDEGAAEKLDDGERASAARGREEEAGVLPQVRPPRGGCRSGGGERGYGSIGAKCRAAGYAPGSFGLACAGAAVMP